MYSTLHALDKCTVLFGPYRSHFLSKKSLIAAKNETKEKRRKEEEETQLVHVKQASKHPCLRVLIKASEIA